MGKTTRKSVFETNSSSSHSITIKVGEDWDNIILDKEGSIYLTGGEFGWQWEKFNDALTKANYCAVTYQTGDKADLLKEVIRDFTGASDVIFNFSTDWKDSHYSYVDHGGWGECAEAFDSYEDLRNFIFNKASWLFLGNDNGSAPNKFYDDPNLKYTHQIVVILTDGEKLTWDLQEFSEEKVEEALKNLLEDVRFNDTKNIWEIDSGYWSGSETYYELKYPNAIDHVKKEIIFTNRHYDIKSELEFTINFEINEI